MKYNEIKKVIKNLSQSQGFYGRLLNQINEVEKNDTNKFKKLVKYLELQKFKDPVDIVLFFEV